MATFSDSLRRRTDDLHKGRASLASACYFVTLVTHGRKPWLTNSKNASVTLAALRAWHEERDGSILAATVLPDHVHVLFKLGSKLTIGQCVGRWKSSSRHRMNFSEKWQRDFWEHRLRSTEHAEDYAQYIFLNPYRAHLLPMTQVWASWWVPDAELFRFSSLLNPAGTPPLEWKNWPEERFAGLSVGE